MLKAHLSVFQSILCAHSNGPRIQNILQSLSLHSKFMNIANMPVTSGNKNNVDQQHYLTSTAACNKIL